MSTNSTEGSHSPSPAALNAPRYGTMVPKRIFVGGISASTTEAELHELFSHYGVVTNAKIIVDRAGVSKGYGFVTFDTEEDAQRAQASANNIMLRDRRLNIAPAIKKQPFSRVYEHIFENKRASDAPATEVGDAIFLSAIPTAQNLTRIRTDTENPTQSVPTGTVLYQNGVPYMYHNGTAFFHPDALAYQYSPPAAAQATTAAVAAASTATTTAGYPLVYQPPVYYPQQTFHYPNLWSAPNGQWRWAAPAASHPAAAHPAYLYPAAMVSPTSNGSPAPCEGQEYQDPAIVETGSEVGAAVMPSTPVRKQDDGGGTPSSLLASVSASTSLGSFWAKRPSSPGTPSKPSDGSTPTPGSVLETSTPTEISRRPRELAPRQRRYTAPPEALCTFLEDCSQDGERDICDGQPHYTEAAKRGGGPGATWRDCLFGTPPTPASTRSQCP